MQRIAIIGASGSGKTTLGFHLGRKLRLDVVDLDELNWEPGWQQVEPEIFDARLAKALESGRWVTSGNYSRVQENYLTPADTLVWLDYSFPRVLWQSLQRVVRRVVWRQSCCNGNYETWRLTFSKDSVLLWLLKTFYRRRISGARIFAAPEYGHLTKFRFNHPAQTQKWLDSL